VPSKEKEGVRGVPAGRGGLTGTPRWCGAGKVIYDVKVPKAAEKKVTGGGHV
jgi:hypothetical protein